MTNHWNTPIISVWSGDCFVPDYSFPGTADAVAREMDEWELQHRYHSSSIGDLYSMWRTNHAP